jgi:SUZ domain
LQLEKRLQSEKNKREQEMNVIDQNGMSNGAEFRPRILQRPKEAPQKVTILKRPDSSSSSNHQQNMNSKPQKSLEQREKEYAEARRRILGSDAEANISTEQIM